jgi:5-methylcytosine-specific restriction protein A
MTGSVRVAQGSRCPRHLHIEKKQHDEKRGTAHQRGYTARWAKESKAFIRAHPLCQCELCQEGKIRVLPSQVTDHDKPHKGDPVLFWDQTNWRALNKRCHDRKTVMRDGGLGRTPPEDVARAAAALRATAQQAPLIPAAQKSRKKNSTGKAASGRGAGSRSGRHD